MKKTRSIGRRSLKYYLGFTFILWNIIVGLLTVDPKDQRGSIAFFVKNIFKTESFALVMPNAAQKHTSHVPWVNSLKKKVTDLLGKTIKS